MHRVGITDVARRAGVSVATASRALNPQPGGRRVKPAHLEAVLKASDELGYRPNRLARSLRSQATQVIGMVVPGISNPFYPRLIEAVETCLAPRDWALLLADSRGQLDAERKHVDSLIERKVDGLIVIGADLKESCELLTEAAQQLPVVQLDRAIIDCATDYVGTDGEAGIKLVIEHAATLGVRRPAFLGALSLGSARLASYLKHSPALGPTAPDRVLNGSFTTAWGEEGLRRLCAESDRPDLVVCGNDLIAFGVLRQARSMGLTVPDDVAVVGFDDTEFASLSDPPLSTVAQPVDAMAAKTVDLITARIAEPGRPIEQMKLTPHLRIRTSMPDATTPRTPEASNER